MARSNNNVVTHGLSGRVDLLVFRQRDGNTIVTTRPRRSLAVSAAQQGIRSTFQQAVLYAKAALSNDATRTAYSAKAKPGQTAYNLAIADFFKAPDIGDIDASNYTGEAGSPIRIAVSDDFKVASVSVMLQNGDGSMTEEGEAILQADGLYWLYTAAKAIVPLAGSTLSVTATDLPGHSSTKQKTM